MAITRAQQAKQMLQKGGRIGLANGAQFKDARRGESISPGTKGKVDPRSGPERRDDNPYRPGPLPPASITPVDKPNIIDETKNFFENLQTQANKKYLMRNIDYYARNKKFAPILLELLRGRKFDESDYLGLEDA